MPSKKVRTIYFEAPSSERFEADIPCGTTLSKVAADFYEAQHWPMQDHLGQGQRAVVELVNPNNPDDTKRLNGDLDICDAVEEGDTLRIFPESIAGTVDQRDRQNALIDDHNKMKALVERNPRITFKANRSYAPDRYEITFNYPSFVELLPGGGKPRIESTHRAEIILHAEYPRKAPYVHWLTPIFHPNIEPVHRIVCLGVLGARYLPGLGLARLVHMLAEMIQWRNFDATHDRYHPAAAKWAADVKNWPHIQAIGGYPFQGPIEQLLKRLDKASQPPITFNRLSSTHREES